MCLLLPTSSGLSDSWLTQSVPRLLHESQIPRSSEKTHFAFRRLHAQQEAVPLRSFRRLAGAELSAEAELGNECCSSNDMCSPMVEL
jgi:hypothetical protein